MNIVYLLVVLTMITPFVVLHFLKRTDKNSMLSGALVSGVSSLLLFGSLYAFTSYVPKDTEVLNGFVTTKEVNRFTCPINTSNPCENGYSCNCRPVTYPCGSNGKGVTTYCTRIDCDTCYKYSWEQNYYVATSLQGERAYKISRVDPQGVIPPPRWVEIQHADPVSITNTYKNYILLSVDSLFREDGKTVEKYKGKIPPYPISIYDYYKIDRLVVVGKYQPDRKLWNESISKTLVRVGPRKHANIVVVVAEGVSDDYANAVRRAWNGFKKNDIVIFLGVDSSGNLKWTRTMSWSKKSRVNVAIESAAMTQFVGKIVDPIAFMSVVEKESLQHFERRSMKDFEYLRAEASLSGIQTFWVWTITVLIVGIGVVVQLGLVASMTGKTIRGVWADHRPYSHYYRPTMTYHNRGTKSRFKVYR